MGANRCVRRLVTEVRRIVRGGGYSLAWMRAMSITWCLILVAGILYFSVIGLSHQ
jgi:hypothetical protein